MPVEGAPASLWVHATAIAIGGRALLITGRSGSGKSRLAAALLAASQPRRRIALVGDDRVLLTPLEGGLQVRPHPRIAGFIERRGFGFVAVPWRERALVAGLTVLDEDAVAAPGWLENLPVLSLVGSDEASRAEAVLAWWADCGKETTPGGASRVRRDPSIMKIGIGKENALVYTRLPKRPWRLV